MIEIGLISSFLRCWNILGVNSSNLTKIAFKTN